MLPEDQKRKYEAFYESTAANDILEPKVTLMIQFAAALALGCSP